MKIKESDRVLVDQEIIEFMNLHGFGYREFAELLGVTYQAVKLWTNGKRYIGLTNSRLLRLFNKYPYLMKEFNK